MSEETNKDACYKKYAAKMPNSARRSQLIAKCRKGKNQVRKTKKGSDLKRWGKEKWKDKISGKDCGSGGSTEYCRPTKRVSKETPNQPKGEKLKKKISEKKRTGMNKRVSSAKKGGILKYQIGGSGIGVATTTAAANTKAPERVFYPFKAMTGKDVLKESPTLNKKEELLKDTSGYNSMVNSVVGKKGGSKEKLEDIMNKISFHESKYLVPVGDKQKYTYFDTTATQVGGGPGRGLFMFEEGKNAGGITAVRRTHNYLTNNNLEVPGWLEKANQKDSINAATLSEAQQKMLFLGNYMEHPKANLKNVIDGKQTVTELWSNYHQTQNDPNKIKNFKDDLEQYSKYLVKANPLKKGGLLKIKRKPLLYKL